MPPATDRRGLLLDIGGVVHATGIDLVGRLAEREPAMQPVLDRIGGVGSDSDELWQQMLRRQVSERQYWAQRAAELGAAVGQTWDTRAMMRQFYELPRQDWLRGEMVDLMVAAKAAGLRVGALTNDMTAFHGADWVDQQEHLKLFDVIVDASLTGVMKPDPEAFRMGAEALGLPAEQIVFLDDMPWNVEGALEAGLIAVRVPWDDPRQAIDTARELLGLPARGLLRTTFREQACHSSASTLWKGARRRRSASCTAGSPRWSRRSWRRRSSGSAPISRSSRRRAGASAVCRPTSRGVTRLRPDAWRPRHAGRMPYSTARDRR
jgi:putative hydrolase of the HAD superfamily